MRFLAVPGRGVPKATHWLREWASRPGWAWAPEPPGPPLVFADRIAALDLAIGASPEPVVLVAHSAGCITTVMWASRHDGPVAAALLVTPPWLREAEPDSDADRRVPMAPLPFRAVLVASRDDPYCTFASAGVYAQAWGAALFDAGEVGHLDSKTGFGPWPAGEALVADLR
ncbi:alpha/beta hydrolase [Glycomyces luteolus]|uniref:Alpha/beta hydrolase n=1 Tax=Glycomyces luteolus TaxID=2670330 RepID=A0A9X3P7C8_9ACTN|nr:alpha/beta hydrolase [Glycomyces luteolus]MDA1360138.1 alpha/beta hydrolase [Glycomyces luteolus]